MVAVLLVFANHLWAWPRGGFVGVDVFFVISGYLITGNLLRTAERRGNVSFRNFYWNRIRRIVPAAAAVLILTYLVAVLVFAPFRAHQVGVDALTAFFFMSNWHFAFRQADYFASGDAVSPLLHFWSLSIEEQFYFVWPALIFLVGLTIARKALTHEHRMRRVGATLAAVIVVSFGWAMHESASAPAWAYLNTFSRVWELGIGALLATLVGPLSRISAQLKPWLSWAGLGLIAASVALIGEGSAGFPAPWALLPVVGSSLVIAAGIGGEPNWQGFLQNPVAVYVGNISYSLYLVHWPVIAILGALVAGQGGVFYVAVGALTFGLAIACYHFLESPLRYGSWRALGDTSEGIKSAAIAALTLVTIGLTALAFHPVPTTPEPAIARPNAQSVDAGKGSQPLGFGSAKLGPLGTELQDHIAESLRATQWPTLDPTMESVIDRSTGTLDPEVARCEHTTPPDPQACTWGAAAAPIRVVLLGDSIALGYGVALRELALNSGGRIQLHIEAMSWCAFTQADLKTPNQAIDEACSARRQHSIAFINETKPDVVLIANRVGINAPLVGGGKIESGDWAKSMRQFVDQFRGSVKRVVWIAPPPEVKKPSECFSAKDSVPADCVSETNGGGRWLTQAQDEQAVAHVEAGTWIDSQQWFCSVEGRCPVFVGSTPARVDDAHMSAVYAQKIFPVIGESLTAAGVF